MPRAQWVTLTEACRISQLTQNQLYARAARGEIRTHRAGHAKPLKFLVEDLERLRRERAAAAPAPAPAAVTASE